jgi:hypothetical protein
MKRPLIAERYRWMMIHVPDSFTAKVCELTLAKYRFLREMKRMVIPKTKKQ